MYGGTTTTCQVCTAPFYIILFKINTCRSKTLERKKKVKGKSLTPTRLQKRFQMQMQMQIYGNERWCNSKFLPLRYIQLLYFKRLIYKSTRKVLHPEWLPGLRNKVNEYDAHGCSAQQFLSHYANSSVNRTKIEVNLGTRIACFIRLRLQVIMEVPCNRNRCLPPRF